MARFCSWMWLVGGACAGPAFCEFDDDDDGVCDDRDRCLGDDAVGDADDDGVCDDLDACDGDDSIGDGDFDGVCDDRDLCEGDDALGDEDRDGVCGEPPGILFVDPSATGRGDGSSWSNAFLDLDLAVAAAAVKPPESRIIWVVAEVFRSVEGAPVLEMVDGLQIHGGFGGDEGSLDERDPLARTVLTGDALNDDEPLDLAGIAARRDDPNDPSRTDNARVVVRVASNVRLERFEIRGGYSAEEQEGIGIVVPPDTTGGVLEDVFVFDNVGAVRNANGVGLAIGSNSEVVVRQSLFRRNIGWNGAAVGHFSNGRSRFEDVEFADNGCIGGQGAGLYTRGGFVDLEDVRFANNRLSGNGGVALVAAAGSGRVVNAIFDANQGPIGAMQLRAGDDWDVINATITGHDGTGTDEGAVVSSPNTRLVNAIFFGNADRDLPPDPENWPAEIRHSCLETDVSAVYPEGANVVLDGMSPETGDPYVNGPDGRRLLSNTAAGDAVTSACVDAGDAANADVDFPAWSQLTTRRDGVLDGADGDPIDPGYHYRPEEP